MMAVQVRHHDDCVLDRDTEERNEADRGGDIERGIGDVKCDQPAERGQRHDAKDQ